MLAAAITAACHHAMGFSIPLDATAPLLRITADQLEVMADRGAFVGLPRLELCDGVLCQVNPQHMPHIRVKMAIYDALRDALRAINSPLGVATDGSVRIGEYEVPMPDVFVWNPRWGRGAVPVEHVRLVVEVSETTLSDDLGRKRRIYAAGGTPGYWVADLGGQVIHQHWSPADDVYTGKALTPFGGLIASATLPGLQMDTSILQDPCDGF